MAPRVIEGRLSRAATAGEPFVAEVLEPVGLEAVEPYGLAELGLSCDRDPETGAWRISGCLAEPGMHEITFAARLGAEDVAVALRLPVSPDPWSLWKDLPVDWSTLPYETPDLWSHRIEGALTLVAASRRGRSHAHKALPRDDAAALAYDAGTGWHMMAVADGAGSATFSRKGAALAVEEALAQLPGLLAAHVDGILARAEADLRAPFGEALGQAMAAAGASVHAFAAEAGEAPGAFYTTLILVVARPVAGAWVVAASAIGDGQAGVLVPGSDDSPALMDPDGGEFAGGTVFLDPALFAEAEARAARCTVRVVPEVTAILAMTDGVSDPLFASDAAANDPAAWEAIWDAHLAPLDPGGAGGEARLLEWLAFKARGYHDDRTIALMLPAQGVR